jgi:flagella basal body P-ring formation protein FlgA
MRIVQAVGCLCAALAASVPAFASRASSGRAADVIAAAVVERMGPGADVQVHLITAGADAFDDVATAAPDPDARIGRSMWFTLRRGAGTPADSVRVQADLEVTADQVIARRPIDRGATLSTADVEAVRRSADGLPLKRLPILAQVLGARTIQPLAVNQLVIASAVSIPKAVQIGDQVTAVVSDGLVQVSATFEAADNGDPGDVIRIVNRDAHRYVRARVIARGQVEVIHD